MKWNYNWCIDLRSRYELCPIRWFSMCTHTEVIDQKLYCIVLQCILIIIMWMYMVICVPCPEKQQFNTISIMKFVNVKMKLCFRMICPNIVTYYNRNNNVNSTDPRAQSTKHIHYLIYNMYCIFMVFNIQYLSIYHISASLFYFCSFFHWKWAESWEWIQNRNEQKQKKKQQTIQMKIKITVRNVHVCIFDMNIKLSKCAVAHTNHLKSRLLVEIHIKHLIIRVWYCYQLVFVIDAIDGVCYLFFALFLFCVLMKTLNKFAFYWSVSNWCWTNSLLDQTIVCFALF